MLGKHNKKRQKIVENSVSDFLLKEAYKTARTNIVYSIVKKGCKKITFTSSMKGEGKTVTSSNIAFALAQQVDVKVLVVECDLRAPKVHTVFRINPVPGLTNYLCDECAIADIIRDTSLPNLKVISYGAIPPNPSELLASEAMENFVSTMEKHFDYIIFDTPPVGLISDALPLAKLSDGVVLIVRNNLTTYTELSKSVDILQRAECKILGIALNGVDMTHTKKSKYYQGYGYYGEEKQS